VTILQPLTLIDPIGKKTPVLDHGYVQAIEAWGCDERIIESARMSTGKGFLEWRELRCRCGAVSHTAHWDGDGKHSRYLYTNKHATPFEMAGMTLEIQAPIFVFREWMRHRTQSYSELSARYTPLPDLNYIPTVERLLSSSKTNKQASTLSNAAILTEDKAVEFQGALLSIYEYQEGLYQTALSNGVPKELARIHLPVGRYSRMRASANLRNWLAFLALRMDHAAQWEIRQYANEVGNVISQLYPRTWELFIEGKRMAE
jgi:thymidylate synthase (FAD)